MNKKSSDNLGGKKMEQTAFAADPVLSMMIAAIIIGAGAGMPLTMISDPVEKIDKFGQKKAGWALGITGLVIGTTVFFRSRGGCANPTGIQRGKADKEIDTILCHSASVGACQRLRKP